MFGEKMAVEIAKFETAQLFALKALVERENIDCDFHLTRAFDVYLDASHAKQTEEAYRKLVQAGVLDLKDVQFMPKRDAERVCIVCSLNSKLPEADIYRYQG
jgi:hypothetical protein